MQQKVQHANESNFDYQKLIDQIRSAAPSGAVGFRVFTGAKTLPVKAEYGSSAFLLGDWPSGVPAGRFEVLFVDAGGKAIRGMPCFVTFGEPVAGDRDREGAEYESLEEEIKRGDANAPGSVSNEQYYAQVNWLRLRQRRIKNVGSARKNSRIDGLEETVAGLVAETTAHVQVVRATIKSLLETAKEVAEAAASVRPPPPQDWAGTIKSCVEGATSMITTAIVAKKEGTEGGAVAALRELKQEVASLRLALPSGTVEASKVAKEPDKAKEPEKTKEADKTDDDERLMGGATGESPSESPPESPPESLSVSMSQPRETNPYRAAWKRIKKTIIDLSDLDIAILVSSPQLAAAFVGMLGQMCPGGALFQW